MDLTKIRALIIDMDGVLWRDAEPIGDLPAIFQKLQDAGIQSAFATNNSTLLPSGFVEKLLSFGVKVQPNQVFTSSTATASYLNTLFPQGGALYVIGDKGLRASLEEKGFTLEGDNPLAVVVGMDRHFNYSKMNLAARYARRGIPLIGTNPDKTFPTPEGLAPGAGSLIAAVETASGVTATIIGKPEPILIQQALEALGTPPAQTLVVGDRLETDIAGGQAAGCPTALTLSGVTEEKAAKAWFPPPDWIGPDLATLVEDIFEDHAG